VIGVNLEAPRQTVDGASGRCPAALHDLLAEAVDYAGLFPPAALSMSDAMAEYAAAQSGPDMWMLGRFVVPATRLEELAPQAPIAAPGGAWRLSAIVRDGSDEDRIAAAGFNASGVRGRAVVDAIESKPGTLEGIDWLADAFCATCDVYVEVGVGADASRWLERIAERGLKAKVRTGGLTADAVPSPSALLAFIDAAVRWRVAFKATAGLHHAVRGTYPLGYEERSPKTTMYGYLNVLLATAARRAGLPLPEAEGLLRQSNAAGLVFTDRSVRWDGVELPLELLREVREQQFTSFGSCSFREPAGELHAVTSF
jgi:hypothetical protein